MYTVLINSFPNLHIDKSFSDAASCGVRHYRHDLHQHHQVLNVAKETGDQAEPGPLVQLRQGRRLIADPLNHTKGLGHALLNMP